MRQLWLGLLCAGRGACAVGTSALIMLGVQGTPIDVMPEAARLGGLGASGRGVSTVRRFAQPPALLQVSGVYCVPITVALAQALPELPRRNAIAVLDSALNRGLIAIKDLDEVRARVRGRRGAAAVAEYWALVDGRAESPLETFVRLDCHDAGLPPDDLQIRLSNQRAQLLARVDMGWHLSDGRWIYAEVDGREVHDRPEALHADRRRQNRVVGGAPLLRYTAADLAMPGWIVEDVRRVAVEMGCPLQAA